MKKIKTIGLLVIVAIIWGKIAWDLFSSSDESTPPEVAMVPVVKETSQVAKKSVGLMPVMRDPFLGIYETEPKSQSKPKRVARFKHPPAKVPEIKMAWPQIQFKGFVKDKQGGNRKVFVSIDNQFSTWTEGDSLRGLYLQSVSNDSIIVSYADQSKTIRRNP